MEYFTYDVGDGMVALVPFPANLPLTERDAYMANPPAEVVATARRERASLFNPPPPAEASDAPQADAPAAPADTTPAVETVDEAPRARRKAPTTDAGEA